MNLETIIGQKVAAIFESEFGKKPEASQIQLAQTKKEFEGDITVVIFPLVKLSGKSPEITANVLGEKLCSQLPEIESFNVVKGFLNLVISDVFWLNFLNHLASQSHFGHSPAKSKSQIMVEYSSPNTNKPLHLGHLRNNFLGYSVSEILKANGHDVIKVQIINDRGIHICKSMLAWQRWGNGETPESSGLKGDKLVGKYYVMFDQAFKKEQNELIANGLTEDEAKVQAPIIQEAQNMLLKWEQKDPEIYALWEMMNGWVYKGFDVTYKSMGVDFDKLYYESNTYLQGKDEVMEGLEKGVLNRREDGSVWCDLREDGLDEKLLLRKDGTAVYMTQDIGTAILRFKDFPNLEKQIYTVGNEQEYHFKVLFKILEKLGFGSASRNFHLSYGMVELPEGKMKSREGTVVDADDLMLEMEEAARDIATEQGKLEGIPDEEKKEIHRMIGMAALKYFLLRVDPKKNMMFDPKESSDFNGNTGPFIQYGYVRTKALLRKTESSPKSPVNTSCKLLAEEKSLIKHLYQYPNVLAQAATTYNPSVVSAFAYESVKLFNSFYHAAPVLKEEDSELRNMRLLLTQECGKLVKNAIGLLGMETPERM
jgi:arginyl-tRNA synthetase